MKKIQVIIVCMAAFCYAHAQNEVIVSKKYVPNSLEIIFSTDELSTLKALMVNTNSDGMLLERKQTSFFAPVNTAFSSNNNGTTQLSNKRMVQFMIETHLIPGKIELDETGKDYTSVAGETLSIKKIGDDYYVNNAKILAFKESADGVIYFIDRVLIPDN